MVSSKQKLSESITIKSSTVDDRLTIRLSAPAKAAFVALQKYKNYSYNGMIMNYLDFYTKFNEGASDKLLSYSRATIGDEVLLSDIEQMFNDFKDSSIPNLSDLSSKVSELTLEVEKLRSQIQHILKQHPYAGTMPTDSTASNIPIFPSDIKESLVYEAEELVKTKFSTSTKSLNAIILNKLKNKTPANFEFTYASYAYNYSNLPSSVNVTEIKSEVDQFTDELLSLLSHYCGNSEMCKAFVPNNIDLLTKYIDARLTKCGITEVVVSDIWNFTLSEIEDIIQSLPKFTATKDFVMNAATLNSPQSVMKTVLRSQYGSIFKNVESFETF